MFGTRGETGSRDNGLSRVATPTRSAPLGPVGGEGRGGRQEREGTKGRGKSHCRILARRVEKSTLGEAPRAVEANRCVAGIGVLELERNRSNKAGLERGPI